MTIPTLPPLERTSPSFAADLDTFFAIDLPATIPAFNAEMERVNQFAFGSYSATSSTSLTIGTGTQSLVVEAGKSFVIGQPLLIANSAAPANWMHGQVTSYNATSGALVVSVTTIHGSGTASAWSVSVTGVSVTASAQATSPPSVAQRTITGADTLIASDQGKLINASGTFTLAVTAAATLGNGWWCYVRNTGTGAVTLALSGAETVDGVATGPVAGTILLACNGTSFTAVKIGGFDTIQLLTSGTSWTAPLGVRRARVRGCGGGGGGGRAADDMTPACAGSGAGYFEGVYPLTPGTAYTYAIGALGAAAAAGNSSGSNGGSTTITINGVTMTGNGGYGGYSTPYTSVEGGTAANGQINIPGKASFSAATTGAPSNIGGDTPLGYGGARVGGAVNASVGYGSGGRGGLNSEVAGDGRPGVIILEY